jgi:transcriptional regulator with XRE-family HTH domain
MTRRDDPTISKDTRQLVEGLTAALRTAKTRRVELEKKLGWSAGYVSRLLKGTIEIRMTHLFAILRAIDMPAWEFFRRAFPPERGSDTARFPVVPFDPELRPTGDDEVLDQRIREVLVGTLKDILQRMDPNADLAPGEPEAPAGRGAARRPASRA